MAAATDDSILYDLLVNAEWPLEGEILSKPGFDLGQLRGSLPKKCWTVTQNSLKWIINGIQHVFSGSSLIEGLPAKLFQIINSSLQWRIALSSDGKLLAVLQHQCIEIRSLKDDFASVVAMCPVEDDPCPQWRRVAWSPECSMLACSYSSGDVAVFDLAGELLFTIPQISSGSVSLPIGLTTAAAGLVFIEHKNSAQWSAELLVISYEGSLTNYLVSPTNGYQENHRFTFTDVLHHGVYCVVYHPRYNMLLLGGAAELHADSILDEEPPPLDCGLSAWRILSGYPHYKLIEDEHIEITAGTDMLKKISKLSPFRSAAGKDGVMNLCLSTDGTKVAALHLSGTLTMWEVPSLRHSYAWYKSEQPAVEDHEADLAFQGLKPKRSAKDDAFYGLTDVNWWTPEALILAHSKGAVTVSAIAESLKNLLGSSPEWCEPWSQVTQAHNGGFLILECESVIRSSRPKVSISEEDGHSLSNEDEESDDEEPTLGTRTKQFASKAMFFLTESDRFQPPVKRPKIMDRTYRLVCIRSTTPEELYARKIELEEYGDALVLAQTYNLDSDLVYQKQWRKSRVSVASIHDYLSKVKNRLWVLNECVERVPEDYDAAKQLLEYGIHGTDARVVYAVGKGETDVDFIVRQQGDEHAHDQGEKDAEELKKIEGSLDFTSFNLEQRDICRYRLKLLQYLDRLATYEVILGGPHVAHEEYDWEFFQSFRDVNIVQAAAEYARDGNHEALEAIFTYHGEHTLPHWLAILYNFPETLSPSEYSTLLPEAGFQQGDPDVLPWKQKSWRGDDWCEQQECKRILEWGEELDLGDFLYEEDPELVQYRAELTPLLLSRWYTNRAADIEMYSKQVTNSLELVKLGLERGVKDLTLLHDDLRTLEVLVYECCTDISLGLDEFQKMSDLERLRIMLAKSSEVCFVGDFKRWAVPFLQRVDKRKPGAQVSLMRHYLTDIAKTDLTYVLKVFQNSTPEIKEPLIPDIGLLLKLALECIYICKRDDQIDTAFSVLECLPAPEEDILSDQIGELNKQIDQLEVNLCACEVLSRHGLPKPVSFIVDTQGNKEEAKILLKTLATMKSRKIPPVKDKEWKTLLKDMLLLQNQAYKCVDALVCYELYTETLLYSGIIDNIVLAGHMLCKSSLEEDHPPSEDPLTGPHLSYSKSVELVLGAAKEYFNSSNDLSDSAMDLARTCLALIEDRPPEIQEEFNLIGALALLDDFGVQILPLEVRLCDDKLGLVKKALEGTPSPYTKVHKILRLATLLQVSGQDDQLRRGRVLMLIAQAALDESDYVFANSTCQDLIKDGYEDAWTVCRKLGETDNYKDPRARQCLLAFALTHCSPDAIEGLINSRSLVETQILYNNLSRQMDIVEEKEEQSKDKPPVSKSLLSSRDWWNKTVTWIRPLSKGTQNGREEHHTEQEDTSSELNQQFHPFYQSLLGPGELNKDDTLPYEKLLYHRKTNSSFKISHCLLRTQKLCECRAEGSVEEPATEVLLQLAEAVLKHDTTLAVAYLLALPKLSEASELFQKHSNNYFCLHLAAYCYALAVYNKRQPELAKEQPAVFRHKPADVVDHVVRHVTHGVPSDWSEDVQILCTCLLQWYNQMSDFSQAQLLQSLGRGVDIGRFARDSEYKRETILGLAMAQEDEVFNTAMCLAERYEVPQWDVLMTHLEWLFSDSGLATKEIQERVNKIEMMTTLLQDAKKMSDHMKSNIYPTIDGTMHARLIYYYMLLQQCEEKQESTQLDGLDASMHLKLLKKIKSAAPDQSRGPTNRSVGMGLNLFAGGLDYKKLMEGDSPVDVIAPLLTNSNVHLLAKIATKIPTKDGGHVHPSWIFRAFLANLFWEGDKKTRDSEVDESIDWTHRYESCHKLLPKLSPSDLTSFIDAITFSARAVDTLQLERRVDIVSRALRFARQQDAARKKKGMEESDEASNNEENTGMTGAISHLEQSARHLESMTDGIIYELIEADEDNDTQYTRLYDLSRSSPDHINVLLSRMVMDGVSLQAINELLRLASRQTPQTWRIADAVQDSITYLLDVLSEKVLNAKRLQGKGAKEILETIIQLVSSHLEDEGKLVTQEDVVSTLRPFCADSNVPTRVKTDVLQILEGSFDLTGEDTFLLLFYQTEALVSAHWKRELSPEDIDSDEKRHVLFLELMEHTSAVQGLVALGSLLQIWPVLAATELSERDPSINPWIQLLVKLIECGDDGESFLALLGNTRTSTALGLQCCIHVFEVLLEKCPDVVALKFGLMAEHEELFHSVISRMKQLQVSKETCDDQLLELLVSSNLTIEVAKTPFLTPYMTYVIAHPDEPTKEQAAATVRGARVKQVASQLQGAGYLSEAGTLLLRYKGMHPMLVTIDSAIGTLSQWLSR